MNDEKLLNLAGGKILYKDLRDRIEETAEEITQATAGAVKFDGSQGLTSEQQETARENIGAVGIDQMDAELNDLWDETDSINDILIKYNCVELLKYKNYTSGTVDGVSFQWTDSNTCAVSGTPTATYARWTMHHISHAVTDEQWSRIKLVPGGTYFLHFNSPSKKVKIEIEYEITQSGGSYDQFVYNTGDALFTIPMSCDAVSISLVVPLESDEVNETVEYGVYSAPSNMELWNGTVKDVQVAGTSIVENGVANVPKAYQNTLGVIKIGVTDGYYGLSVNSNGLIRVSPSSSNQIKSGTEDYKPITPNRQHESSFYGLAKASGDTTQSSSSNAVGTYTPEAKGAIQQMLGVSDLIAPVENDLVASQAYAIGDIFTANGKLYKVITAIVADGAIVLQNDGETVSGANAVETKIGEGFVKFTDYATSSTPGVVIANSSYGISVGGDGILRLGTATVNNCKQQTGSTGYQNITVFNQHAASFYGLATAAGDTTQKASSNVVGTYTDNAKASIKAMLGITQTLTVTVLTQDSVTVTGQTVTVRADDAAGEIYATAAYEGQPVSFSLPSGFQYYVNVSDTLDHHFNPTTARGVVTNTDIAVTLTYSDFSTIRTAPDIKAALNAGLDLTDLVGEQITCVKNDETLTWDVVDYNATNKCVTLLLHDCFGTANMVFEPAQALMWCENGLAAGSYTFTWNTTQCYFTLTTAIPAGGQLRANTTNFWTYESQDATATLETDTVSTDAISGATDLGHEGQGLLNHRDRVSYGSNNYAESALYWWLNSDAPANTKRTPVTKFSRAHSYAQPGFLNGLDSNFIAVLDNRVWLCACNNVYECPQELGGYTRGTGQTYTVTAKVGLASEMEIFGSYGGNQDGSTIFALYDGATADDRKKYRGTAAQYWWLRSPGWSAAGGERSVSSSGSAVHSYAYSSYGCVPAVSISADI